MPTKKEVTTFNKSLILVGLLSLTVACKQESKPTSDVNAEQPTSSTEVVELNKTYDQETQNAISQLRWVEQFDLKSEVANSIKQKDFRLLVIAKRGPNVPGIELNQQASLKSSCGEKYLEGIGDVLFGDAHKKLYDKAIQLASEYNRLVAPHCEETITTK
ncbi:hypothetical protein [Aliikangiella sp. IMCC44359]|uniref:hypothetical protein n=1 Tax=Aliikangiella sp. IMCC44359 TaxID=3459125 RepID=UPI00403AD2AD